MGIEWAAGIDNGVMTVDQQVLHNVGPGLAVLFEGPFKLAQVVGIA